MVPDLHRYHRQMLLPGFGEAGQRRLSNSTVLVLGCGALGTVSANILARAGVGRLIIVDRDYIELTNLQRQVLFDEQDIADALPKAEAARRKIAAINSQVCVTAVVDDIHHGNIERLADGADILLDGLDNFETRYLANDYAVKYGKPYVYGGAVGSTGMGFAILPHSQDASSPWETTTAGSFATPCFRCIFEEAPPPGESPTCDTVGVLGPAVSIIANFQASETLKILTGNFGHLNPAMLSIDLWTNSVNQLKVGSAWEHGDCPCCKERSFEFLEGKAGSRTTVLCGRDAIQLNHKHQSGRLNFGEIARRLRQHGTVQANEFMLRAEIGDSGNVYELTLFADGRAIVKGTSDTSVAKGLYAKYIGN